MRVVGVDLGGTKLATAVFSDGGDVLEREVTSVAGKRGSDVGAVVADRIAAATARRECDALGVCVPGIYHASTGTVWAPNIPGWDDYPLRDELHERFGDELRITIDSDRAAYILGEIWRGSAHGASDAIFLAVGTGIGAGILSGGRIVRGYQDIAGAIGWMALDRPFARRYVDHGCFEDQASGPGLVRVARDLIDADPAYHGELRRIRAGQLSTHDIFTAHENEDPVAVQVIDNAIELWGMAAANLVSLFNPELIVFGGGVFGPATSFLTRIHDEARRWGQPISMKSVRFLASELGHDAGLFGAGRLALMGTENRA